MEYRRLGRTGLKVSTLSFGSWVTFNHQMNVERASTCMKRANDVGIPSDSRAALPGFEWLKARFESDEGRAKLRTVAKLHALADRLQLSLPRLALAWCLKNPHVSTVILGASRVEQLEENLKAGNDTALLTPEVMAELDRLTST